MRKKYLVKAYILLLTSSIIWSCSPISENQFSTNYEFDINFFSANREELILDYSKTQSLSGQYNYSSEIYNHQSLQKDSMKVFKFIETAKQKILKGNQVIYKYGYSSSSEPYILPVKNENIESYFFRCDTEFIESKNGDLSPLIINDTTQYSDAKRLDLTQEWFYNYETNEIEVQNICYSFAIAKYDEIMEYKGLMPMYIIKQGEFSSIENQKKITEDINTVWAQRIIMNIPLTDFLNDYTGRRKSSPIKSINNSQLGALLFNQVKEGNLKAYKPQSGTIYSNLELDSLIKSRVDTIFIENEYGIIDSIVSINPYTAREVGPIGVKQEIVFNSESLEIKSKIKSIMVSITPWDYDGKLKGHKKLFEVKF
jgi:hypothetical protein